MLHNAFGVRRVLVGSFLVAFACGGTLGSTQSPEVTSSSEGTPLARVPARQLTPLQRAGAALERSLYEEAREHFEAAARDPATREKATLGLARVAFITGRYEDAARDPEDGPRLGPELAVVRARALRELGRVEQAVALLGALPSPAVPEARLVLGELLLELGRREAGQAALMTLIEDYNEDRISERQGRELAMVGRAAHLLKSPEDANDAFNQAELAGAKDFQTLLWRAALYLEKFDLAHAEEVITEILARAPRHPEALVLMAELQLEQALDFEQASGLARDALAVNPNARRAHGVLAGIVLRDLEIERADEHLVRGLTLHPRDPELSSLRAAARFLADDTEGFERIRQQVFSQNPHYAEFYRIVSKYADWEHRYDEIVEMMRRAVAIDPDDGGAHAQLGINLIRNGQDAAGVAALRTAFAKDPYNVRVFNTLNLYEKTIPESYVDVTALPFRVRYHREEQPVLQRYVPDLLNRAWGKMRGFYEFTPSTPVGVELYAERPNFAVRTSGLPRTAISGVCFGKTLASMTPRHEAMNLGMTLWHELAHVFHIQLSRSRVPRWFTEGLAEYETLVERPEWRREQDSQLYQALREQRLPQLRSMNQAFTHAEDIADVAVAYYASTQIVEMMAQRYGRAKLRRMLVLWGEGKRTDEVLQLALGRSPEELDAEFRAFVGERLSRYDTQFVPLERIGDPRRIQQAADAAPDDPEAQVRLALLLMRHGAGDLARAALERAIRVNPGHPDVLFTKAELVLQQGNHILAESLLDRLVSSGHDGYRVRIAVARAARARDDVPALIRALREAHELDPTESEPLLGLLEHARDPTERLEWLRRLAKLEEHRGEIHRELTEALLAADRVEEAVTAGEAGVYAAMEDPAMHVAYARALQAAGQTKRAEFEFESAIACPASPKQLAQAHLAFARHAQAQRRVKFAEEQLRRARALDPELSDQGLE